MLKLFLTDGKQSIVGLELVYIKSLSSSMAVGCKIALQNVYISILSLFIIIYLYKMYIYNNHYLSLIIFISISDIYRY
jgi:hypothetical protein